MSGGAAAPIIHTRCVVGITIQPNTNTLFGLLLRLNRIFGAAHMDVNPENILFVIVSMAALRLFCWHDMTWHGLWFVVSTVLHDNQLTHTDLKPENILFVSSDADIIYNTQKVGTNSAVGDTGVDIAVRSDYHNVSDIMRTCV